MRRLWSVDNDYDDKGLLVHPAGAPSDAGTGHVAPGETIGPFTYDQLNAFCGELVWIDWKAGTLEIWKPSDNLKK